MPFGFDDLDDVTRGFMVEELDYDLTRDRLYRSRYFSSAGDERYPALCRSALESGDEVSLADDLRQPGTFVAEYQKKKPKGGFTMAAVPHTAAVTAAEGEFNRFYLRGVCRRVLAEGGDQVEVYRARPSGEPRSSSLAMIGKLLDADTLLSDLRESLGVDTALGLPPGPNSGLSGRIPRGS